MKPGGLIIWTHILYLRCTLLLPITSPPKEFQALGNLGIIALLIRCPGELQFLSARDRFVNPNARRVDLTESPLNLIANEGYLLSCIA